jgi:hypothetical protein
MSYLTTPSVAKLYRIEKAGKQMEDNFQIKKENVVAYRGNILACP